MAAFVTCLGSASFFLPYSFFSFFHSIPSSLAVSYTLALYPVLSLCPSFFFFRSFAAQMTYPSVRLAHYSQFFHSSNAIVPSPWPERPKQTSRTSRPAATSATASAACTPLRPQPRAVPLTTARTMVSTGSQTQLTGVQSASFAPVPAGASFGCGTSKRAG